MDTFFQRYTVGPLLYCPATNTNISSSIINEKFGKNFSLALCLEDTIDSNHVEEAEQTLIQTLHTLEQKLSNHKFYLPKIFIRVREPNQITRLYHNLNSSALLVTGFIIPKLSLENVDTYMNHIGELLSPTDSPIYMMPILENRSMLHLQYRADILYQLKEKLDHLSDQVLNIRVGGNDLCHVFGFRRKSTETIYDIMPISNMLSDIMTVFGEDYVVSGPVWEYYDGYNWNKGLEKELNKDRLNGFVGKTVIHPKQIPLVNKAYMVSKADYDDAVSILNWNTTSKVLVSGSVSSCRMNEYNTHINWAKKILALSQIYGVQSILAKSGHTYA